MSILIPVVFHTSVKEGRLNRKKTQNYYIHPNLALFDASLSLFFVGPLITLLSREIIVTPPVCKLLLHKFWFWNNIIQSVNIPYHSQIPFQHYTNVQKWCLLPLYNRFNLFKIFIWLVESLPPKTLVTFAPAAAAVARARKFESMLTDWHGRCFLYWSAGKFSSNNAHPRTRLRNPYICLYFLSKSPLKRLIILIML